MEENVKVGWVEVREKRQKINKVPIQTIKRREGKKKRKEGGREGGREARWLCVVSPDRVDGDEVCGHDPACAP